jgi:hypothetical protein
MEAFTHYTSLQFETGSLFSPPMPNFYDRMVIEPLKRLINQRKIDSPDYKAEYRKIEKIAGVYKKELRRRLGFKTDNVYPVKATFAQELQDIMAKEQERRCRQSYGPPRNPSPAKQRSSLD